MDMGEVPAEGWQIYLRQEEARLMAERVPNYRPATPIDPANDIELYTQTLDPARTQLQVDWDQFVTFGEQLQMASEPRSLTPSPILSALNRPMGWPMTRASSPTRDVHRPRRARVQTREATRRNLRHKPLWATSQGRAILQMAERVWYLAPSGFAVMQYPADAAVWQPNDEANYLHWLDADIRIHRSTTHRLLCVENINDLNRILADAGSPPIILLPTPRDPALAWCQTEVTRRGLPTFLRAGYSRQKELGSLARRLREQAEADARGAIDAAERFRPWPPFTAQREDAGQAAGDAKAARGSPSQAASARGEQDGDGLLHRVDAGESGAPADDRARRDDSSGALPNAVPQVSSP